MTFSFYHFNFNVMDLEREPPLLFRSAGPFPRPGNKPGGRIIQARFSRDGKTDFQLELTWLRGAPRLNDLGEDEFHLAMRDGRICRRAEKTRRDGRGLL